MLCCSNRNQRPLRASSHRDNFYFFRELGSSFVALFIRKFSLKAMKNIEHLTTDQLLPAGLLHQILTLPLVFPTTKSRHESNSVTSDTKI